jgi:glycosyltransferase involved in cell wall biosynthesis
VKILVVSNLYPPHAIGGYEERCRQIIDRLRARGHDVRVLTSTHGVNVETCEGHVHRRLWIHGFFGHPWLPIHRLYALEKHNHDVLREELTEFAPDVVHVWNLGGLSKGLMLTLQAQKAPVVYDVSDHWIARSLRADVWLSWWNGNSGGKGAAVVRALLRGSGLAGLLHRNAPFASWSELRWDRIYFCSGALKELTREKGYNVGHAAVIYCGTQTERFARREPNARFTRLLYVGRLADDKDPVTAIRAMKHLPESFTLALYGKGDPDDVAKLREEAKPFGNRVEFKSAGPEEMTRVYAAHDALLFTSAWAEPFALTPLEAMAAELPVISTLEGGSRELVRHGENALAFRTSDPADLAAQVLRLESDPSLRAALVKTASEEVRARYDMERIVDQVEVYLQDSLKPV